jgi:hypothetical protein
MLVFSAPVNPKLILNHRGSPKAIAAKPNRLALPQASRQQSPETLTRQAQRAAS